MYKVLIVEDDPMVRQINEKFLEKIDGFKLVASVSNIEEGMDILEKSSLDIVLLDLFFPNEKGQDLIKWIRANGYQCDVIIITADKAVKTIEELLRFGIVDYLIKPFTFERLKESLNRYKLRKQKFDDEKNIEQSQLDKYVFFEGESEEKVPIDDNQFNKHTYDKVLRYLQNHENGRYTALEVADDIGVSRITARRYLDLLEKENLVIMNLEYGKIGRPKNRYKIK